MRLKSTLVALSALMAASPAVSSAGEITVWADATRQPVEPVPGNLPPRLA